MTQHAMYTDLHAPHLRVDYVEATQLEAWLAEPDVLAVFGFGPAAPGADDPRYLRVPLAPHGAAPLEIWRGRGELLRVAKATSAGPPMASCCLARSKLKKAKAVLRKLRAKPIRR